MGQKPSDADLRARLTPEQYRVTRGQGTERAITGEHSHNKRTGQRSCINSAALDFRPESAS